MTQQYKATQLLVNVSKILLSEKLPVSGSGQDGMAACCCSMSYRMHVEEIQFIIESGLDLTNL